MAQPTQDTDISSSFTVHDCFQNNEQTSDKFDSNGNEFNNDMTMNQKRKMSLIEEHQYCSDTSEDYECQKLQENESECIILSEDNFPWLITFNKLICSSVGNRSYNLLQHLISVYTENILTSLDAACLKMNEIIKLRNHLKNTLTFFHFYWQDIKEHVCNHNSYLNKMTLLLGMYMDMELKTLKHSKHALKITARLITRIWIYLNNSEQHIFRVLLRVKLVTKKYAKICDPIFMKSFNNCKKNVEPITDMVYIRYLLALKLWKKIKNDVGDRKKLNKLALRMLGPDMPKLRDELLKFIPEPPSQQENKTIWFLQTNVFDLKQACKQFITLEDSMNTPVQLKNSYLNETFNVNHYQKSQLSSLRVNRFNEDSVDYIPSIGEIVSQNVKHLENVIFNNKSANAKHFTKRTRKLKKRKPKASLKPGEVVLIDLTEDDNGSLKKDEQKKIKKKCKGKLRWLKIMQKRHKEQKEVDGVQHRRQVEIADAHSTESIENSEDKTALKYLPISDNKVSESTEKCAIFKKDLLKNHTRSTSIENVQDFCKRNKDLKSMLLHKQCNICSLSLQHEELQHNRFSCLLKLLNIVGYNIRDPKLILNLIAQSKQQSLMPANSSFLSKNVVDVCRATNTQGRQELIPEQNDFIDAIAFSKKCQNSAAEMESLKEELPTSTDYDVIIMSTGNYCDNESPCVQNHDYHLNKSTFISDRVSQIPENEKKQTSCEIDKCPGCSKNVDFHSFFYNYGNTNVIKTEDRIQNILEDSPGDKKSIDDKNVICMLSDLDKCMDVLNRISEHIMSVHAEKQREQCLEKADVCAVSTTFPGDQITEPSLGCWAKDNNSISNTGKLDSILGLCDKKPYLDACHSKALCVSSNKQTAGIPNQLNHADQNCKQEITISTSESEKLYPREDSIVPPDNLHPHSIHNRIIKTESIKTEVEEVNDDEEIKSSNTVGQELQTTSENEVAVTNTPTNLSDCASLDVKDIKTDSHQALTRQSSLQCYLQSDESTLSKVGCTEEFGNIDILDSILNGDMSMEDEQVFFDDSQSSMMSPIHYDNSTNVLNCITEFFSQSENEYMDKDEEKSYVTSDTESFSNPLPEGSLGTTGILNSLLDFDLTNMDSSPSDFMYSHVQTVDPRLIKKDISKENFPPAVCDEIGSQCEKPGISSNQSSAENMVLKKEKDLDDNQNTSIDSSADGRKTCVELKEQQSSIHHPQKLDTANPTGPSTERFSSENTPSEVSLQDRADSLITKETLNSYNLPSSKNLISPIADNLACKLVDCNNLQKQAVCDTAQKRSQHVCVDKQNRSTPRDIEFNSNSKSSKQKYRYERKCKERSEEAEFSSVTEVRPNELCLQGIDSVNHKNIERPMPLFCESYKQKSSHKTCNSKSTPKQIKYELRDLQPTTDPKQDIIYTSRKSTADEIIKQNPSTVISQDFIKIEYSEATHVSCKAIRKSNTPHSRNSNCFEFPSGNMKTGVDVNMKQFMNDKSLTDVPNNIRMQPSNKWSVQNITTQPSKFVKRRLVGTKMVLNSEEAPLKKRRISSKFLPVLKTDAILCSTNKHEDEEKHLVSMQTDFACANRRRNGVA